MAAIGFIGLGTMGGAMATHLVEAGHDVTVYDLRPSAVEALADTGATPAGSAPAAAEGASAVFLSLPGPAEVEAVVDEIEPSLEPGAVLVDLTTSTPGTTTAVAERLADRDVAVLGAPVSGGGAGARNGTLSVIAGGDPDAYAAVEGLLEAFTADRFHLGEDPGAGNAAKLLNNFLSFSGYLAACEATVLGQLYGLEFDDLVDVFNASTGRNVATEDKLPNYVTEGEDMGFAVGLFEKDLSLLTAFAEEQNAPLLLGSAVRQQAGYARAAEGEDADIRAIYGFLERMMTA